ncbi:hypothetical protein KUC3_28910 [Alteromonas sp. KC3]|uniref:hypothetical protein n=1 Tax=unclassified Alteromonas TaxID=2614992 RepID=UPI001920BF4F|nr:MULTISPECIES: hypothetical protein [unclassified Alteromonas]BCO20034.1 hypothetical protein KUC3_28910 [Alteromonas sp. KC3]BCO23999.1 hypothetical protein KUC14_28680 [Alteromonas sp. KC14]
MAKKIIFIHGRAIKPKKDELEKLWHAAVTHGLERDFGPEAAQRFEGVAKEFVYYYHHWNTISQKGYEEPQSRWAALEHLKSFGKSDFNKNNYKEIARLGSLKEALADTFSATLGVLGVAEPLISLVAPDMEHYFNGDSYYGSDARYELTKVLKRAFDDGDDVMLVSHSLGTMISFDNLWKFSHYSEYRNKYGKNKRIELFVTMGSPLGDENIKKRLKGAKNENEHKYPTNIKRWVNFSAEDDYISHDSKIDNDYKGMKELGLLPNGIEDVFIYNLNLRNNKSNPHGSSGYLIHPKFAELMNDWLLEE